MQIIKWTIGTLGFLIAAVGLIDLPDQFDKWNNVLTQMDMTAEHARWILAIAGFAIMLLATDSHRWLYRKFTRQWRHPDQRLRETLVYFQPGRWLVWHTAIMPEQTGMYIMGEFSSDQSVFHSSMSGDTCHLGGTLLQAYASSKKH